MLSQQMVRRVAALQTTVNVPCFLQNSGSRVLMGKCEATVVHEIVDILLALGKQNFARNDGNQNGGDDGSADANHDCD